MVVELVELSGAREDRSGSGHGDAMTGGVLGKVYERIPFEERQSGGGLGLRLTSD